MSINQTTPRAIIDWATFNIGNGATVAFTQPGATSVAVNRVGLSGGQSSIAGTLTATGHVMLLNPNGVAFTSTAVVNVGGLIASTGNINDAEFMSGGAFSISNPANGAISNAATPTVGCPTCGITVSGAGLVAFVAPSVSNSGTITATGGRIVLANAQTATISLTGGLYEIAVGPAAGGLISNTGTLNATGGGSIVLSALDAASLVSGVINLQGVQQANTIEVDGGHVVLKSSLNAPTVTGSSNTIDVYSSAHVQDAIDIATTGSVGAGATVNVYPGNYTETAMNRQIGAGVGGTYDLGLLVNKDNLTLRGVDTNGNPITSANSVQAWITAGNSTDFGMNDGIVANNVTIQGMGFKPYAPGPNKTIEIAGDNLTFMNSVVDNRSAVGGAGALYFGELLTDHQIEKLTVTGSIFLDGSVSLQNGVGVAADGVTYQPAADRVISGNTFTGSSNYTFGGVLLTGEMAEIPWRPLPIGAATVTGNSFSGFTDSVLVRGAQQGVDLTQIMKDNSFDHAVLVTDAAGNARGQTYLSTPDDVTFTPRLEYSIQSSIQAGINRAVNSDTVTVGAGTYAENLTIGKALTLDGAGRGVSIIDPVSGDAVSISGNIGAGASIVIDGFTLRDAPRYGVNVAGTTILGQLTIQNSDFLGNGQNGFFLNGSATAGAPGLSSVSLVNDTFESNGAVANPSSLGYGDILFNFYNGNVTLSGLHITGSGEFIGVQMRGASPTPNQPMAMGTVAFNDVTIDGSFLRPNVVNGNHNVGTFDPGGPGDAIHIQEYSSVANLSFTNTVLNPTMGHGLYLEGLGSMVNIGNTVFGAPDTTNKGIASATFPTYSYNIFDGSNDNSLITNVNATSATFTGAANGFAIEDRVFHALDATGLGLVTWNPGNLYVTQASGSIQRGIDAASAGNTVNVAAGTYAENVTVNGLLNLSFNGSTMHTLTFNSGAAGSGIGGSATADSAPGFMFNAPIVLLSDTSLHTNGANIALNGDIQNAGATSHALTLVAGSGAALGDANMVTGGTQSNPLGEFDVTSNNFTLLSTLWVTGYKIDAASNVALSNHTLRAVDASASNVINAGGNVTGTTISSGNSQVTGSGDVSANVTAQGDVVVSGNNVSGNLTGNNIVVGAQNSVNANVNATSTVVVNANGPANLSGSSPILTVDAPSGNVSGSFSQINNAGSSIISLNGTPQAPATISASANSNQLIPSGTSIVDNTAAGGTSDGNSANSLLAASEGEDATGKSGGAGHAAPVVRRSPARAGELFYKGRSVEIDLSPSNNR